MTMLAIEPQPADQHWGRIAAHAPVLAATCQDYVAQISVSARPSTTKAVDRCLRIFADWLTEHDQDVLAFRQINRRHIEHYKLWLASRENQRGEPLKKSTINQRLGFPPERGGFLIGVGRPFWAQPCITSSPSRGSWAI